MIKYHRTHHSNLPGTFCFTCMEVPKRGFLHSEIAVDIYFCYDCLHKAGIPFEIIRPTKKELNHGDTISSNNK